MSHRKPECTERLAARRASMRKVTAFYFCPRSFRMRSISNGPALVSICNSSAESQQTRAEPVRHIRDNAFVRYRITVQLPKPME